jgi:hypothetical protein
MNIEERRLRILKVDEYRREKTENIEERRLRILKREDSEDRRKKIYED